MTRQDSAAEAGGALEIRFRSAKMQIAVAKPFERRAVGAGEIGIQ